MIFDLKIYLLLYIYTNINYRPADISQWTFLWQTANYCNNEIIVHFHLIVNWPAFTVESLIFKDFQM